MEMFTNTSWDHFQLKMSTFGFYLQVEVSTAEKKVQTIEYVYVLSERCPIP